MAFTGRRVWASLLLGEASALDGLGGATVPPFWDDASQSRLLGCRAAQRRRDNAWGHPGQTLLLSLALGWSCILGPRVCKRFQTTGAGGGQGQGIQLSGSGSVLTVFLLLFLLFALNRKETPLLLLTFTIFSPMFSSNLLSISEVHQAEPEQTPIHLLSLPFSYLGKNDIKTDNKRMAGRLVGQVAEPC